MYVYWKNGEFYEVGYSGKDGRWWPESRHRRIDTAAARVSFLNGGENPYHPYTVIEVGEVIQLPTFD